MPEASIEEVDFGPLQHFEQNLQVISEVDEAVACFRIAHDAGGCASHIVAKRGCGLDTRTDWAKIFWVPGQAVSSAPGLEGRCSTFLVSKLF